MSRTPVFNGGFNAIASLRKQRGGTLAHGRSDAGPDRVLGYRPVNAIQ